MLLKHSLQEPVLRKEFDEAMQNIKILPAILSNYEVSKRSFVITSPMFITSEELAKSYHLLCKTEHEEGTKPDSKVSTTRILLLVDRQGSMTPFHHMSEDF